MSKTFRIGAVSYLNAKPLIEGIPSNSLFLSPPKTLAEEFHKGTLDVALLPTFTLFQNRDLRVIRGLGIGCEGTILSVFIKPSTSPSNFTFKTLKPSPESMTSNRLAEVILKKYHASPFEWCETEPDGEVIIGDRAFAFKAQNPTYPLLDLGEAWWNATELPFTFALWVIPPHLSAEEGLTIAAHLKKAWALGEKRIASYAKTPLEFQYLSHYLRFKHDSRDEQGIEKFQNDLIEIGSLDRKNSWQWV